MSTVGFDNTSEDFSGLNGSGTWNSSGNDWLLSSKNGLGSGLSNLVSEVLPVSSFVIRDGALDLREDIFTVDDEVFTNVVGKVGWAIEDFDHFFELGPVSLKASAIRHAGLNSFQKISDFFQSRDNFFSSTLFEILVSSLGISEDVLGISDAVVDIIEMFGVESTLEDTLNDSGKLQSVKFDFLLGFAINGGDESEVGKVFHFVLVFY